MAYLLPLRRDLRHNVWSLEIEVNVLPVMGLPLCSQLRENMRCEEYIRIETTLWHFFCCRVMNKGCQGDTHNRQLTDTTTDFEFPLRNYRTWYNFK